MTDWRDGRDPKPTRKAPAQPKSEKPPAAPATSDWRGNRRRAAAAASAASASAANRDRNWTGSEEIAKAPTGWRRRVFLVCATIALPLLTTWYIQHLFRKPPKIPLFVCVPTRYSALELGENPFSTQALTLFQKTNPDNILLINDPGQTLSDVPQDVMLDNIQQDEQWQVKYKTKGLKNQNNRVLGGGPERNFIAVYLNGFVLPEHTGDQNKVRFVTVAADEPFDRSSIDKRSIELSQLLDRVLKAFHPQSMIWIALDVRTPPITSNLGDLNCPLRQQTEKWWDNLPNTDRRRIIITLPGKDGQENWYAPELTSTVFGHFYRLGMAGAFDKQTFSEGSVTLAEMQVKLEDRVQQWVRDHRYAIQTPQWLIDPETSKRAQSIKIVYTNGPTRFPAPKSYPENNPLVERYDTLQRQWKQLAELRQPYRWNPLATAKVESLLLRMEDLVEADATNVSWNEMNDLVVSGLLQLKNTVPAPPRVSLIEHSSHNDYYFQDTSAQARRQAELDLWQNIPPWRILPPAPPTASPPAASPTTANAPTTPPATTPEVASVTTPSATWLKATRDEKCQLIVSMFAQRAAERNEALWENTFNERVLKWSLDFVGPTPENTTEWLEIQLLRLMLSEVDWKNDENIVDKNHLRNRSISCARYFRAFHEVQRIGSHPNHELSWWLKGNVLKMEQSLLRSFDLLSASQTSLALTELDALDPLLAEVSRSADRLHQAMQCRDEAAWLIPHMLTWLMRKYQFAKEPDQFANCLEALGNLASDSQDLHRLLTPVLNSQDDLQVGSGQLTKIEDVRQRVAQLIRKQLDTFQMEIDKLRQSPKPNPQSVRNFRLAVRTPLIDLTSRAEFQRTLETWYTDRNVNPLKDSGADTADEQSLDLADLVERDVSDAAEIFLQHVRKSESYTTSYMSMANGDLRSDIIPELPRTTPNVSNQTGDILTAVANEAYRMRTLALAIGSNFSLHRRENVLAADWPWSSPLQMQMLGHAHHHQLQIERLALASWGDRDLGGVRAAGQLYFHRLASAYSVGGQIKSLQPIANINPAFLRRAEDKLDNAVRTIMQLKTEFASGADAVRAKARSQVLKFSIPVTNTNAVPAIYLGREKRVPLEQSDRQRLTQAVDLSLNKPTHDLQLDADPASLNDLVISLRGNYRLRRLAVSDAPINRDTIISMNRPEAEVPTIRVSHTINRATNIIVMMDCSASMGNPAPDPTNPGKSREAFELARATTSQLIQAIEEIHTIQPIKLSLLLFGLDASGLPASLNRQIEVSDQTYFTGSNLATRGFAAELQSIINSGLVTPSGCTPLYDALQVALRQTDGEPCLIYVVSDGFNDVRNPNYHGIRSKKDDVKRLLGNDRLLHVFQFKGQRDKYSLPEDEERRAETELIDLASPERYLRTSNFDEIKQKILDALPRSVVVIRSGTREIARGYFGSPISVPISKGDELPYRIEVLATVGPKSNLQTKQQSVQLIGGEDLRLEFDTDSERLRFIELRTEDQFFALAPARPEPFDSARYPLRIGALPRFDQLQSQDKISFQIGIRHENERNEFTPRPLIVLARLGQAGAPPTLDTLLADFRLEVNRHYPIISLPEIDWKTEVGGNVPNANLKVWMAFDNVKFKLPPVSIIDGENVQVPQLPAVKIRRSDQTVTVELPQPATDEDRLFVVCPQSERSRRQYNSQTLTETHEFTLYDSATGPATIQLVTVEQLRTAVNNKQLLEVQFNDIKVSR